MWTKTILEKFRNARKYRKRTYGQTDQGPVTPVQSKKGKLLPSELDIKAIEQELKNERPREDILVQLMSSTFAARRSLVQSKQVVVEILKTYPALKMTAIVS